MRQAAVPLPGPRLPQAPPVTLRLDVADACFPDSDRGPIVVRVCYSLQLHQHFYALPLLLTVFVKHKQARGSTFGTVPTICPAEGKAHTDYCPKGCKYLEDSDMRQLAAVFWPLLAALRGPA